MSHWPTHNCTALSYCRRRRRRPQQGLKTGLLFRVPFRTNPSDRNQGYCTLPGLPTDVFVRVRRRRRRCQPAAAVAAILSQLVLLVLLVLYPLKPADAGPFPSPAARVPGVSPPLQALDAQLERTPKHSRHGCMHACMHA